MKLWIPRPEILPLQHPEYPWYLGSPDALVDPLNTISGGLVATGGVDFKTTGSHAGWGEPGTDEVPDWIHTQADWYMGLTEAQWWDIAVLFFSPRREFAIYRIPRNQELIDNLIEAGRDFWENHVVPHIPPELDASEASGKLLKSLYPDSKGELLRAPESAYDWRTKLTIANQMIRDYEEQKKLAQHHLEALVGDADSLLWPDGWRFDWKRQKDRTIIDWEGAFTYLSKQISDDPLTRSIKNEFTTTKPGTRVPRLWPPKGAK